MTQTSITFSVPGEPWSKARARIVNGHAYTPERTKIAETGVMAAFLQQRRTWRPDDCTAFEVRADFYAGTRQRRDIDNMLKLVLDGLNGVAWSDDVLVVAVAARKHFVPKAEARTVVTITQVPADLSHCQPCAQCGKLFKAYESTKDRVRFCSPPCRVEAQRIKRGASHDAICKHCGITFYSRRVLRKPVYCSTACNKLDRTITLPCAQCGTPFERPLSWATNGRPYCNIECRIAWHREHKAIAARGTCTTCGKHTSKKCYRRCLACKIEGNWEVQT